MSEKIHTLIVPSYLEDLKIATFNAEICNSQIREEEYAEIGFLLLDIANGNKDALKKVSDFIRMEHRRLKDSYENMERFVYTVENWLINNRNWVVMSPKRIEIEEEEGLR